MLLATTSIFVPDFNQTYKPPSIKSPVKIHFCWTVVFTRHAIGNGTQRTKKSRSILATPFHRKNSTVSIQWPGRLWFQNLAIGEHPAIAVIVQAMKYAITKTPVAHKAQRKPLTTPKIR
jgi:hypothetical protein